MTPDPIPRKRVPAETLARRARRQKRLQAGSWVAAALMVATALVLPLVPVVPLVASWWILAGLGLLALCIPILSLRRLKAHHAAANPPDPLEGRVRKDVDFDTTWRDIQ